MLLKQGDMRREVPIRYAIGSARSRLTGLAVIAFIALASLIMASLEPRITHCGVQAREDVARWESVEFATDAFRLFRSKYPALPCPPSLYALNEFTNKRGIDDPWGTDYRFVCSASEQRMVVQSAGEDRRFGTADDIGSD